MDLVTGIALGVQLLAAVLFVAALLRRRSLADRVVALDSLLACVIGGLAVYAARTGAGTYIDILVVAALLGFLSTVTVARFIERRGA